MWKLIHRGFLHAPDTSSSRSSGVHVSQCVQAACEARGLLRHNTPIKPTLLQTGLAIERAIISMYEESDPARFVRPGEILYDGLIGTPDLHDVIDDVVDEIKATYMSSDVDPASPKFFKYDLQIAAYCTMMGTPRSRLSIEHLGGNYRSKDGPDPVMHVWERLWTRGELIDNWALLKTYARKVKPEQH